MGQYHPRSNTQRWVVRRKVELIEAIRNGDLSLEDACNLYALSFDEIISWRVAFARHGVDGLRATQVPSYRRKSGRAGLAPTV